MEVSLEGVRGKVVLTRWRALSLGEPSLASCLRALGGAWQPAGLAVERVGTNGLTITFRERGGRRILGCDSAPARSGRRSSWCGLADGELRGGRLVDPRLGIGCRSREGRPLGFAWIEPGASARYVAVERRGYVEVYPAAEGLPARVVTEEVEPDEARAAFRVAELDRRGRLLRRYTLEAVVAG